MYPESRFLLAGMHVLVSTHAAAVVVAVVAGTLLALRRARDPLAVLWATPVVALATLGGAHLGFVALRGDSGAPGGLVSMAGIASMLAAIALAAVVLRVRVIDLLDAFAPAALLALAIGRVGCFLAGCCHGAPTTLPWGIVVPSAGELPRHPLQLYSAAVDLLLVGWLLHAPQTLGSVARRACVGFGFARFGLELLRDPATTTMLPGAVLTLPQGVCLVLVVTGLVAGTGLIRLPRPALRQASGRGAGHDVGASRR